MKKSKIANYWLLHPLFIGDIDLGEPSCMICGYYRESWDDWDQCQLQKCHIVPKMLGGTDEPENIILLCLNCHDLMPDTDNKELTFKWIKHKKLNPENTRIFSDAIEISCFDTDLTKLDIQEMRKACLSAIKKTGFHGRQMSGGSTIKPISFFLNAIKELEAAGKASQVKPA